MSGNLGVDRATALAQWTSVCAAFRQAGSNIKQIEAVPDLEDMVFTANQTFIGKARGKKFCVVSTMRHDSRKREVPHFVEWFRRHGYEIFAPQLPEGEFLEGGGDLLWDEDARFVWAGYGFRTTLGGVQAAQAALRDLNVTFVPLQLADERFYHLDTCLAPLTGGAVLIYPQAFTPDALEAIREHATRVHEVAESDALGFVCNGVTAGKTFITSRVTPSLERALAAEGMSAQVVNTSEFERSGGSVCCLKQWLAE
jgi:arginine dihydrolase